MTSNFRNKPVCLSGTLMLLVRKSWVCQRKRWTNRTNKPIADSLDDPKLLTAEAILWVSFGASLLIAVPPKRTRLVSSLRRTEVARTTKNENKKMIASLKPTLKLSSSWRSRPLRSLPLESLGPQLRLPCLMGKRHHSHYIVCTYYSLSYRSARSSTQIPRSGSLTLRECSFLRDFELVHWLIEPVDFRLRVCFLSLEPFEIVG